MMAWAKKGVVSYEKNMESVTGADVNDIDFVINICRRSWRSPG